MSPSTCVCVATDAITLTNTCTRPDLSFVVSVSARKMANPLKRDWIAAKRVLRYIQGTSGYGIKYFGGRKQLLIGYADADWAGDESTGKCTSGYVFLVANGLLAGQQRSKA